MEERQVDKHRNKDCRYYNEYLMKAALEKWEGLTCFYCKFKEVKEESKSRDRESEEISWWRREE